LIISSVVFFPEQVGYIEQYHAKQYSEEEYNLACNSIVSCNKFTGRDREQIDNNYKDKRKKKLEGFIVLHGHSLL
jgi:hypothetical protein